MAKDYKKTAEKLEKEIVRLKALVKTSYQNGYDEAYTEIEKMDALYEKHMIKAEKEFAKKMAKKPAKKKAVSKKTVAKKPAAKKATPNKVASRTTKKTAKK